MGKKSDGNECRRKSRMGKTEKDLAKCGGRRNVGKGVNKGRCRKYGKVEKIVMGPARLTRTLAGKMAFKK